MKSKRLYFIDTVRAFAILMMLQGHFIDTLLKPIYRDESNLAYNIWSYFRGITAPTFFTIAGLVFLYLLLKAHAKGNDKQRIKKGLTRGIMLIGIGYLLRINFFELLKGNFNDYFLVVDVLQCIGLSLIMMIGLYILSAKNSIVLAVLLLAIGCACFVTEPIYRTIRLENLPLFIANYMTKYNGSIFTILPWFGYMAFGGFIATMFFNFFEKKWFKQITIASFLIIGYILIHYSSLILHRIFYASGIELFEWSANYNFLFTRLGNVLILFAVFYTLERFLKQSIITRIGEKTLNIYVVHFMIIYGSFTGIGLKNFFYKDLNPWEAIIGAIVFMIIVCLIVFHIGKTNVFIYKHLRRLLHLVKRTNKNDIDDDDSDED